MTACNLMILLQYDFCSRSHTLYVVLYETAQSAGIFSLCDTNWLGYGLPGISVLYSRSAHRVIALGLEESIPTIASFEYSNPRSFILGAALCWASHCQMLFLFLHSTTHLRSMLSWSTLMRQTFLPFQISNAAPACETRAVRLFIHFSHL